MPALHLKLPGKPTPSIAQEQLTVHKEEGNISLEISGRHDPVIVPRAVVVMECMTAITVLDALLTNMTSKIDDIKKFTCLETDILYSRADLQTKFQLVRRNLSCAIKALIELGILKEHSRVKKKVFYTTCF